MRTAILAALFAATLMPGQAQEEKPKPRPRVQKIIQLKYVDPRPLYEVLRVFNCGVVANENLKVISLDCFADVMPAVEDVIKRLDVPSGGPTNIELTAYFLVASDKPETSGAPVPAELNAVVKQIESVFAFKNFSLLDAELIRGAQGEGGEASGRISTPGMLSQPTITQFKVSRWSVNEKVVSLANLRAGLRIPVPNAQGVNYIDTGLTLGKVDVTVGEKVVIGKSSMEGPGKALVIVLTARVP